MQFIQALLFSRWRSRSAGVADLSQVRTAARRVMHHVGLAGQLHCLATQDEEGRAGVLLSIETPQCIPAEVRAEFQHYFQRKLNELGALHGVPLRLVVHDLNDQVQARKAPAGSSSARIASLVAASNADRGRDDPAGQLADLRQAVQLRRHARREREWHRYADAALTDLGALPAQ